MTTLRFIDHGVACNGVEPDPEAPGKNRACGRTVWRSETEGLTGASIGVFRAHLRAKGWTLTVLSDDKNAEPRDYCPKCQDQA